MNVLEGPTRKFILSPLCVTLFKLSFVSFALGKILQTWEDQ